jgi:membrane carboxypeptidase/penicillin-binding protein
LTPAATAHIRNAAAEADVIRAILSLLGFIFSWLTLGVVAIALGVGAILWVYARGLPDHEQLANYTPPTISRIYSSEGRLIDEFARERRLFVPAADIPDRVKHAFIAAEDQNFYTHQGYDPRGIAAALRDAIVTRGETLRGASTITQQVMKNFLLSGDRTGERKVKEIILAARIEQTLSKDDILELYLNEIFLGQNSFGVAAAARTYFNKTLEELTIPEAAYLAALPKAPSDYHPVRQHEAALDRRAYVLGRMFEDGYITEFEYLTASAAPLETVQSGEIESARASRPPRDHFTDEIRRQFTETLRGDLPGIESEEDFFTGGLSIRATMDPVLQDVAAQLIGQWWSFRVGRRIRRSRGVRVLRVIDGPELGLLRMAGRNPGPGSGAKQAQRYDQTSARAPATHEAGASSRLSGQGEQQRLGRRIAVQRGVPGRLRQPTRCGDCWKSSRPTQRLPSRYSIATIFYLGTRW